MSLAYRVNNGCCCFCNEPITDHPIRGSVGVGGNNISDDVKIVQQFLNALSPLEGGPGEMLKVDGIVGPKTTTSITKYQTKVLGWADSRIDPHGKTIKILANYIVDSPTIPYGPLGYSRSPQAHGTGTTPTPTSPADQVLAVAVANICMRVIASRINLLRWKLTRVSPTMEALLNKHFAHNKNKINNTDIAHIQKILSGIDYYIARFNAFGKLPVENVILFDPIPTTDVIAWTVRGGNKMSTKQIQIYYDKGKPIKAPGQSIWITNLFEEQPREEKHWTILHEFAHFTGARDGQAGTVDDADKGYTFEGHFLSLSKYTRLHNAESLSLFFLECIFGTKTVVGLPRLSLYKAHFDTFPKVNSNGELVNS